GTHQGAQHDAQPERRSSADRCGKSPGAKAAEIKLTARLSLLQLFQRPRPVFAQKTAERAVGQKSAFGLTASAVIRLVGAVADALHLGAAPWARLTVATVHSHAFAKGGNFLRKFFACLVAKRLCPLSERFPGRLIKPGNLVRLHALRQHDGRELRAM